MKRMLMLILLLFAVGCSSSNSTGGTSGGTTGTPMEGTWSITGSVQCTQCGSGGSPSYQVAFVSSPCSVSTPVGTFSVQGSVCFIANNNSGQGSISGTGLLSTANNNGVGVLVGTAANPVADGATINLVFVGASGNNFYEFTGSGTVTKGAMGGAGIAVPTRLPARELRPHFQGPGSRRAGPRMHGIELTFS